jgi:amino acid transporter
MNEPSRSRRISVNGAIALGVGSMVGAGIFALMGEAAAMAGSAVWLSFLVAGIIALLTGHSFAQLGVRYPSRGGVVEYLVKAYGPGLFSGGCSILFYIAQLIGMAMIALAFGKFSAKLLEPRRSGSAALGTAPGIRSDRHSGCAQPGRRQVRQLRPAAGRPRQPGGPRPLYGRAVDARGRG